MTMNQVGGVGLEGYLTVAAILFVIGIFGIFVNRRNVIIIPITNNIAATVR